MRSDQRVFIFLYAASGAAALVYEIAWTRLLTLQMGHTVAAASTVLAAFMGGLALGSWLGGRLESRAMPRFSTAGAARPRAYAACELVLALAAMGLPAVAAGGAIWLASRPMTIDTELAGHPPQKPKIKPRDSLRAERAPRSTLTPALPRVATAAAAISGFVALVYEVAWTRLLVLVVGPTTYAF